MWKKYKNINENNLISLYPFPTPENFNKIKL